ncbi:2409_t:CDS:2 [Diversispora eburnea]|uniref:2409_t:CDS:1 n=1 Tax=Diversispora eburnea TaxID=1213867 RepID=A0A9N8VEG4_9GLOM|nr:2409_t:CDS:2 [Diversispora eburnea]
MLSFPRECLEEVFHHLEYDKAALYNCLLVNRFWCRSTVSSLWKRPFQLVKKPSPELIEIYISLLDNQVKNKLILEGVLNTSYSSSPKRLFDYPIFLREFRFDDLYDFVSAWLKDSCYQGKNEIKKETVAFDDLRITKILVNELCKLILSKIPVIYSLSLNTQRLIGSIDIRFWSHHPNYIQYTPTSFEEFRNSYGFDDLLQLPSYAGANCLPYLQRFEYGGDATDGKIMQVLSMICKNLNTLEISFSSWQRKHADPMMMLTLLQAQHSLKRMILRRGGSNRLHIIIEGLKSQANSLKYLEFNGADFRGSISLSAISSCVNLESLIFDKCLGLSDEIIEPLANTSFLRLKKFVFRKSIGFRDLRNMLQQPQLPIKDIRLGRKVYIRRPASIVSQGLDGPPSLVLSTLSIYCPRLKVLETHISRDTLPHFLLLLETSVHLEQLYISIGSELIVDEIFWKTLAQSLPLKLRNLMIVIEGTFWLIILHWLLGNCINIPLETLQFPRSVCIDDEYLCIITQYAKIMGTLKRLALAKRSKVSSEGLRRALVVFQNVTRTGEWFEDDD